MRIGVDATCWANERGYGRFTRELVSAMVEQAPADEFVCFLDERARARFALAGPNVVPVVVRQRVSPTQAASADSSRSLGDMLRLTRAVRRARPAVFFSPSVYTYFPLPPGLPAVVTIHDAIAERFPELTLPSRRARLFWNAKVALALRQARLVLTVSDYAAREVAAVHRIPAARLRVALEAPAAAYRPSENPAEVAAAAAAAGIPAGARWLVYVGGFNPHKHLDILVRAHGSIASRLADPPFLLLVGALEGDVFHGAQAAIRAAIAQAGTEPLIRWTGFVPDEVLRHLLSGAVALALPSASEGFGLPAIEAAACGTPVVATTASPLPQLLEGGGLFVAPGDADALTGALLQLLSDEPARRALGAMARRRALALSWEAGAKSALAALHEAAA
ncbi:MAG TPA: glycosyltransferase family 1 protein [Gemmatimonadales bacterium]|jgi:glycosyltransferase involved in cell wall biosynthesis|nr:glycosyltransferase family 1 protein [Gemmatimonadales bacterium]